MLIHSKSPNSGLKSPNCGAPVNMFSDKNDTTVPSILYYNTKRMKNNGSTSGYKKSRGASEYLVENTRQGGPEDIPPSQWRKEKKCTKKKETTTSSTKRNEGNAVRRGPHEELTCATQSKRRQKPLHLKERYNRKHANCLRLAYSGSNTC